MKFALALARKRLGGNGKESNCKSLYSAFQFFDANGSGTIDREEFSNAFDYLGIQMKEGEFEKILQAFEDVNGDGEIDYFEFVRSFAPSMTKVYKCVRGKAKGGSIRRRRPPPTAQHGGRAHGALGRT